MSGSSGDDLNRTLLGPPSSASNTMSIGPLDPNLSLSGSSSSTKGDDQALATALATLPNYEIEKKLGEGGMGAVYRARQKNLQRTVAIKVLPQRLVNNAMYVARLNREAMVLAKMSHANVTSCFDLGEHQGMRYVVMEFVEGDTLGHLIDSRKSLPQREALHYLKQAVSGLDYANSLGIIHRDIKPENLLLSKPRSTQTTVRMAAGYALKIADLGLAAFTAEETENTRLTTEGSTIGSPHYMSPEQTVGETDLDFRTDQYALGITLYHMITGKLPFVANTVGAVLARKLSEKLLDPRVEKPDLSATVSLLIQRMTAPKKDDRYTSYGDLLQDIENIESGKPLSIVPLPAAKAGMILLPDTLKMLKASGALAGSTNYMLYGGVAGFAMLTVIFFWMLFDRGKTRPAIFKVPAVAVAPTPETPLKVPAIRIAPPEVFKTTPPPDVFATQSLIDKTKRSTAGWTFTGEAKDFQFQEGALFLQHLKGWNFAERQLPGSEFVLRANIQTPTGGDECEVHVGIAEKQYIACGIRLPANAKRVSAYVERRDIKTNAVLESLAKIDDLSVDDAHNLRIQLWDNQATCFLNDTFMVSAEVDSAAMPKRLRLGVRNGIAQYSLLEVSPRAAAK